MHTAHPLTRQPRPVLAAVILALVIVLVIALVSPAAEAASAEPQEGPGTAAVTSAAVRPVAGPMVRPFDPPAHAYGPGHRGVDLAVEPGDPVVSALDGDVVFSGLVAGVGWVTVDHGGGLVTTYGDLVDRIPTGAAVLAGGVVGRVADTAVHLDWGVRLDDAYIEPLLLLRRWRLHLAAP